MRTIIVRNRIVDSNSAVSPCTPRSTLLNVTKIGHVATTKRAEVRMLLEGVEAW